MWNLHDLNRVSWFDHSIEGRLRGWTSILVTDGEHPYLGKWWVPGLSIGYEHSFVHAVADFIDGLSTGKPASPTFREALETTSVCDAILKSGKSEEMGEGRGKAAHVALPGFPRRARRAGIGRRLRRRQQLGYLGKYQFGELALIDVGYYTADGHRRNDWKAAYLTGKDGVDSKADFLADGAAQEHAIRAYMKLQWAYLGETERFAGQTIGGLKVTESGLLAGAHLLGAGAVTAFLEGGAVAPPSDAYGTAITEYMTLFAGYDTPFTADHSAARQSPAARRTMSSAASAAGMRSRRGRRRQAQGRRGADFLDGGDGGDDLSGGRGSDVFRFADCPMRASRSREGFPLRPRHDRARRRCLLRPAGGAARCGHVPVREGEGRRRPHPLRPSHRCAPLRRGRQR